jgi:crotonobetainyl-CoA:carnitine CoA-transferase CaiB-like acyl-CoA transferase
VSPDAAFDGLASLLGPLPRPIFTGTEPVLTSPFRCASAAAAALGAGAGAAALLWQQRGGAGQDISVDLRAAAASLVSFALMKLDGGPPPDRPAAHMPSVALHRARDGRWIHLHGSFPHLLQGTLEVLEAENSADSIAAAVARWDAFDLEAALAQRGMCGAVARSAAEWRASPQGRALDGIPPIRLIRVGDAPPLRLEKSASPLDGIRVLDLTRILAGPSCGRTLASYGADVLNIRAAHLPTVPVFDLDTGHGKRSLALDLTRLDGLKTAQALARDAHIFVESYRPGAFARHGLAGAALPAIQVAIDCYGHDGPWAARPGWEQLAQTATGIAVEQGAPDAPKLIGAAACDYITGYLAAAGAIGALLRQNEEGGRWRVEVSLCATAMWLQSLGRTTPAAAWQPADDIGPYRRQIRTEGALLDFLGPVVRMSRTPPSWRSAPPRFGSAEARWLG